MRKKYLLILGIVMLLLATTAAPAMAEEVEDPLIWLFPDVEHELVVFWNVTRDAFCEWEASGFEGDPPAEELITVTLVETPSGALRGMFQATGYLELWPLDDDADLSGACQDTDDQTGPWAVGYANLKANDNDIPGETLRNNVFGDRGDGVVYDGDGQAWSYSWEFRAIIRGTEALGEEFNVLIDESSLLPL